MNEKFKKIKLIAFDFDGVMTNGYVYVDENGKESVRCSRRDGLGIAMLKKNDINVIVISKEKNPVVSVRCKKLNIKCWQAVEDSNAKLDILKKVASDMDLSLDDMAYVGDDLNDEEALRNVGLAITVQDGHEKIKKVCHYITKAKGGEHAVREICEEILKAKGFLLNF
ncbi:HAD-IIIA family hydrolase [Candidatus Parcubacteria bacterium]|nr:HAD-IIIA family hydrolase [Candidatus Parcubacteria bacterium]MCG2694418.1 HAD-IIIA family hydrolase [Candidatus Parcubacteria bacterium]